LGTPADFVGHAGGDNFVIITTDGASQGIRQKLKDRFNEEVKSHYNFIDRQQGFVLAPSADGQMEQFPLMTLAIGMVAPSQQSFSDIREITELAAEARRQDAGGVAKA
jgi:hypothetical protein